MKTKFTTLVLLFIINLSFAQDKLFLKNSSVINGKVVEINKTVVHIKVNGKGKAKRYTDRDVEKATIVTNDKEIEYTYQSVPFLGKVLLGKLCEGKVDLYIAYTYVQGSGPDSNSAGGIGPGSIGNTWTMFYMKKDNEDKFFDANYDGALLNKFHNRVSKYLEDCPSLAQKVKNKELKKSDIVEIAELYNSCK